MKHLNNHVFEEEFIDFITQVLGVNNVAAWGGRAIVRYSVQHLNVSRAGVATGSYGPSEGLVYVWLRVLHIAFIFWRRYIVFTTTAFVTWFGISIETWFRYIVTMTTVNSMHWCVLGGGWVSDRYWRRFISIRIVFRFFGPHMRSLTLLFGSVRPLISPRFYWWSYITSRTSRTINTFIRRKSSVTVIQRNCNGVWSATMGKTSVTTFKTTR